MGTGFGTHLGAPHSVPLLGYQMRCPFWVPVLVLASFGSIFFWICIIKTDPQKWNQIWYPYLGTRFGDHFWDPDYVPIWGYRFWLPLLFNTDAKVGAGLVIYFGYRLTYIAPKAALGFCLFRIWGTSFGTMVKAPRKIILFFMFFICCQISQCARTVELAQG